MDRIRYWNSFWGKSQSWGKPRVNILELAVKIRDSKDKILAADLGSGNGRYTTSIANLKIYIDSYDFSEASLDLIRKKLNKRTGRYVRLFRTDLTKTNSLRGKYDLIISSGLLEELSTKSKKHLLNLIEKSTKKGSLVILRYLLDDRRASRLEDVFYVKQGYLLKIINMKKWDVVYLDESENVKKDNHPVKIGGPNVVHYHRVGELHLRRK